MVTPQTKGKDGSHPVKILALESSAVAASAALCEDETLIAQAFQNSGLTHSRTLLPMVDSMLTSSGHTLAQADVIAVAAGPGSFTGLRIGVAAAKGLAWVEDKDCAPCSTLESMAWPLAHMEGAVIVCAMDARRKQVYNALFLARGGQLERLCPDRAVPLTQLDEELKNYTNRKIVVGDGAQLCYNTLAGQADGLALAPRLLRMQSAWGGARAAEELAARGEETQEERLRIFRQHRERVLEEIATLQKHLQKIDWKISLMQKKTEAAGPEQAPK